MSRRNCENGLRLSEHIKSTASFDSMENSQPDPKSDCVDDKGENSTKADKSGTEMRNSTLKQKLTSEFDNKTQSEDDKEKTKKKQAWRAYRWLEHLSGATTDMKEGTAKRKLTSEDETP